MQILIKIAVSAINIKENDSQLRVVFFAYISQFHIYIYPLFSEYE